MSSRQQVESGIHALITGGVLHNHAAAQQLGLHAIDLQALHLLAIAGGSGAPSALAATMRTPRSSVSRIVRRLEAAGYVHRRESPHDRRSVTVEVDRDRLAAVTAEYQQPSGRLAHVLATFNDNEVAVIVRFLDALLDHDVPPGAPAQPGEPTIRSAPPRSAQESAASQPGGRGLSGGATG
ncbi:winged helix-turn-helix transcriptional regulator [Nocardia uniformis]|uniref:Winged helix-turn-helix transcriptional regulator n=1 Tax=Nocardia uniformis TaxID=53432 RepID=A0A849CB13_9NOCA|nr:MarR family winged helix-turn-helix transcriptional regulator [Nocardia uniformis]NNH75722.1 winged helix-turn-helix transcriptional regulator [Nocardia uniformis]